jgi:hypothetical protein
MGRGKAKPKDSTAPAKPRKARSAAHLALAKKCQKAAEMLNNAATKVTNWGVDGLGDSLQAAAAQVTDAHERLSAIPADFAPGRSSGYAAGDVVVVKEKYVDTYNGAFDTSRALTVVSMKDAFLTCKAIFDGEQEVTVVVPRRHIESYKPEAAA